MPSTRNSSNQEPDIIQLPGIQLAGMHLNMSFANNRTQDLWRNFMPLKMRASHLAGRDMYSLQIYPPGYNPLQDDPTTQFTKWAAIEIKEGEDIPDAVEKMLLPGGLYAVFEHQGPASAFLQTFQFIFQTWLPASGYQEDDRPHFELLEVGYSPDDLNAREMIYIPIKQKQPKR